MTQMPLKVSRGASVAVLAMAAALAGCAPSGLERSASPAPVIRSVSQGPVAAEGSFQELASGITEVFPGTQLVSAAPGPEKCAPGQVPVVRMVLPERVFFESGRDEPGREAAQVLDFVAASVRRETHAAEITVLGHTDAYGSDAFNLDLSRRRAQTVMRGLVARQLPAGQVTGVAVGKRQPVAGNDTPGGRARNRRVEFLISPCLAANLELISRVAPDAGYSLPNESEAMPQTPVEVLRLTPAGPDTYTLDTVDTISLRIPAAPEARPAPIRQPAPMARPGPSAAPASQSPSPAYVPNTVAPDVERTPLGPAISY